MRGARHGVAGYLADAGAAGGAGAAGAGARLPALIAPPDILLSADGKLAAIHAGGDMFVQQRDGFSGFTQDSWRQMWAARVRALPEQPEQGVGCTPHACRLHLRDGEATTILLLGEATDEDCAAALLLSLEPIHLRCPAPVPDAFDRFDLWRDGALAVWLRPDAPRVLTDRQSRGVRPWVPQAPE